MYRHFDFYRARVVVINEYRPFLRHHEIQRRYANYRDFRPYVVIRDARDPRYFANRNHPEHYRWLKERERRDDRYRDDRNRRDNDRRYNDRRDNDRRDNDRKKVVKKNSKDNNKKDNRNDNRDNNRNDNRDSNRNDNRDNNRSGGSIYRR